MSRKMTKEQLETHRDIALQQLDNYIGRLISSDDSRDNGRADKLSYWIEDWTTFLDFEHAFSPSSLRRYKRGEVIKAHLGYNVGSEEGGLHYCVVLDKKNSKNSPVVTIVPLTSVKARTDINHLHYGNVYLGNELFTNLNSKITITNKRLQERISLLHQLSEKGDNLSPKEQELFDKEFDEGTREEVLLIRMREEVRKMKLGSIALTSQIRTISKIRIYDPKTNFDILSNVKLSNEKLDLIDREILHSFTGCCK